MAEDVRQYWEDRAANSAGATTATTDDVYQRELEIVTFAAELKKLNLPEKARILDAGCGDGYTTLLTAEALPVAYTFQGVDYAANMIANALKNLAARPALKDRVKFAVGDATKLSQQFPDAPFDAVLSSRCLINLETQDAQAKAIGEIAKCLKPGGYYLGIENFMEGQANLTAARASVGLPEIPVRWHNRFFTEAEFRAAAARHFEIVDILDFSSSYYFATRVIYSALCQRRNEKPDYRHEIHQFAGALPPFGQFSPIRMAILRRKRPEPMVPA